MERRITRYHLVLKSLLLLDRSSSSCLILECVGSLPLCMLCTLICYLSRLHIRETSVPICEHVLKLLRGSIGTRAAAWTGGLSTVEDVHYRRRQRQQVISLLLLIPISISIHGSADEGRSISWLELYDSGFVFLGVILPIFLISHSTHRSKVGEQKWKRWTTRLWKL